MKDDWRKTAITKISKLNDVQGPLKNNSIKTLSLTVCYLHARTGKLKAPCAQSAYRASEIHQCVKYAKLVWDIVLAIGRWERLCRKMSQLALRCGDCLLFV
jgi:hypothetical protein